SDGSLVDDGAVDAAPEPGGEVRVARLQRERPLDLLLDPPVAEAREVRRTAREPDAEVVGCRGKVGGPPEEPGLRSAVRLERRLEEDLVGHTFRTGAVAEAVEKRRCEPRLSPLPLRLQHGDRHAACARGCNEPTRPREVGGAPLAVARMKRVRAVALIAGKVRRQDLARRLRSYECGGRARRGGS